MEENSEIVNTHANHTKSKKISNSIDSINQTENSNDQKTSSYNVMHPHLNENRDHNIKRDISSPKIKRENLKSDFLSHETCSPTIKSPNRNNVDKVLNKKFSFNEDTKCNVKKEVDKTKMENGNDEQCKSMELEDSMQNMRTSANSSPFKDKKRKKVFEDVAMDQLLPPTNHDRLISDTIYPPAQKAFVTKIYYSYFERTNDDKDEIK